MSIAQTIIAHLSFNQFGCNIGPEAIMASQAFGHLYGDGAAVTLYEDGSYRSYRSAQG